MPPGSPCPALNSRCVAVVEQRREIAVGDEHDVAAAPAVAAVGPAARHELLAAEADAAVAAVAGSDVDRRLVDEVSHKVGSTSDTN